MEFLLFCAILIMIQYYTSYYVAVMSILGYMYSFCDRSWSVRSQSIDATLAISPISPKCLYLLRHLPIEGENLLVFDLEPLAGKE